MFVFFLLHYFVLQISLSNLYICFHPADTVEHIKTLILSALTLVFTFCLTQFRAMYAVLSSPFLSSVHAFVL